MSDMFTIGKLNDIEQKQKLLLEGQKIMADQLSAIEGMLVTLLRNTEKPNLHQPPVPVVGSPSLPRVSGAPAQRAHLKGQGK